MNLYIKNSKFWYNEDHIELAKKIYFDYQKYINISTKKLKNI